MKSSVMTPARIVGACLCGLLLCGPIATHAQETGEPTHAQAELPKVALTITGHDNVRHVFSVEKAMTPREQQVGEMYRKSVPADGGMIFVWSFPRQSDMWMQHTLVPLDIVFIGADNQISSIVENAVPLSLAHISSHGPVRATLELQGGLTEKLGIVVGDKVESAALSDTKNAAP